MREIRQSGSEGGGLKPMSPPYPYMHNRHGHREHANVAAFDFSLKKATAPILPAITQATHVFIFWSAGSNPNLAAVA